MKITRWVVKVPILDWFETTVEAGTEAEAREKADSEVRDLGFEIDDRESKAWRIDEPDRPR